MRRARPAAAKAAAKGAPRLRRPAAAVPRRAVPPAPGPVGVDLVEKYQKGEEVVPVDLQPGTFSRGDWLEVTDGTYYQKAARAAGKVQKEEIAGGEREVVIELTGTDNEDLLKFGTSLKPACLRLHLCGAHCNQRRENPDLLHVKKVRKLAEGGARTWEINLLEEVETQGLRDEQEELRRLEALQKKKDKASSSSSGRKGKKSKKKKKRKKSKDKDKGEEASPAKKKQRMGGKKIARKSLDSLYLGTGMDPSPTNRKRLIKKTQKALKKSNPSSSSTSTSSTGSEGSEDEGEAEILQDRSRVHRISVLAPGLLSSNAIAQMKTHLVQVTGTGWEQDSQGLPPLLSLYHRCYLQQKVSGGVAREVATLCCAGDLLIQGRPSEALDTLVQRLKSIEMTANGSAWMTSQKLELAPTAEATLSTRQEAQVAYKEAKLDSSVKGAASSSEKGKGKSKERTKDRGKEKGKGKGKESEGKKA
eukprot:Skav231768  [mRNA]  locus=scaffold739:112499:113923:- [translate_table: standard]